MTEHGSNPGRRTYDVIIGLEVHAQLRDREQDVLRLFDARSALRRTPSTCPTCLGLPGALPVPNARGRRPRRLRWRWRSAARCRRDPCFARKHYFYPDLPKGYQITQYDRPLATGGALSWRPAGRTRTVRLVRVHLEEDAGKSLHEGFPDSADVGLSRLQPERRAARRDRDGARPARPPADAAEFVAPAARDARGHRRVGREHGGGRPAVRRQRVAAPARRGARSARGPRSRT